MCKSMNKGINLKFLLRALQNSELKLLITTIVLSVLCVSSLLFVTHGIRTGLEDSTGALLGGDRLLSSPMPIDTEILKKAEMLGLKYTQNTTFYSMLLKDKNSHPSQENEELALAEIKAVDENYPLKGELHSSKNLYSDDEKNQKLIPEPGSVWLEANLFSLLDINIGDTIKIGYLPLTVARVLTFEPDRGGEGLSLAPRALINRADIPKTKVIAEGSRQTYKLLLTGPNEKLEQFTSWLQPKL